MKRLTHTLSNGTRIRVYDNGGKSIDRITVVIDGTNTPHNNGYDMLGMCLDGSAFSQHTTGHEGPHLGKRVAFNSLGVATRNHIERRLGGDE